MKNEEGTFENTYNKKISGYFSEYIHIEVLLRIHTTMEARATGALSVCRNCLASSVRRKLECSPSPSSAMKGMPCVTRNPQPKLNRALAPASCFSRPAGMPRRLPAASWRGAKGPGRRAHNWVVGVSPPHARTRVYVHARWLAGALLPLSCSSPPAPAPT